MISLPVLFDTGTGNKRRLIDVKSVAVVMGKRCVKLCLAYTLSLAATTPAHLSGEVK